MFVATVMLYKKLGENWTTPPDCIRRFTPEDEALLTVDGTFCISSDNDGLISAPLYEKGTIVLPDWLTPEQWLRDIVSWKYAWGAGVDPRWPERRQCTLRHLRGTAERMAAVALLKTKTFRSPVRQSLCEQLVAWLDTPPGERKYPLSPFSQKQWNMLINSHLALDAKRVDGSLYRSRYDAGVPRCGGSRQDCDTAEACQNDPNRAVDCLWGVPKAAKPIGPKGMLDKLKEHPLPNRPDF